MISEQNVAIPWHVVTSYRVVQRFVNRRMENLDACAALKAMERRTDVKHFWVSNVLGFCSKRAWCFHHSLSVVSHTSSYLDGFSCGLCLRLVPSKWRRLESVSSNWVKNCCFEIVSFWISGCSATFRYGTFGPNVYFSSEKSWRSVYFRVISIRPWKRF